MRRQYRATLSLLLLVFAIIASLAAAQQDELFDSSNSTDTSNITTSNNNTTPSTKMQATADCATCTAQEAVLFPWFVELLGCFSMFILTRFNIPIPHAAVMFILGAAMGTGASLQDDHTTNALGNSTLLWTTLNSEVLLLVFLPGLIFKDAVTIPIHLFLVALLQIWILAFPMVLLGTALTALVGYYLLPYHWPWSAAATLGAILASTDPIAVSSVLKTAGASPRLVMHISGESLLNDGSSFVFFTIFSQLYYATMNTTMDDDQEQATMTVADGFVLFFRMSLGGTAVGAAFAAGLLLILWELDRRLEREFDILQVVAGLTTAYLCYYTCDQLLEMSGVVAVVTCGVIVNYFGKGLINDEQLMESYLVLAEYLLNTLLFALGGVIWGSISFEKRLSYQIRGEDWGWLFVLYVLVLVIRFVQVACFYPILSRIGLKSNWREAAFLAYGGLRGAVGVALGLSLVRSVFENTKDPEDRKLTTVIQFLGGGVTLLTLTINGTSAGPILKKLGLAKPVVSKSRVKVLFEGMAKDYVYQSIADLFQEPRFQNVSFAILQEHVPFVTKEPPRAQMYNDNIPGRSSLAAVPYSTRMFNLRIAGGGAQFLQVLDITERISSAGEGRSKSRDQLLVEMRQVFLELLGEAYKLELELGHLDETEDNGFLFQVLMDSVNLALNEVEHSKCRIEDWKWTEKFRPLETGLRRSFQTPPAASGYFSAVSRGSSSQRQQEQPFRSSLASMLSSVESESTVAASAVKTLGARQIRLDVLRAVVFQQGHAMAEAKIQLYINRIDNDNGGLQSVLNQILEESHEQVSLAQEMLDQEIGPRDLEFILSKYCARILIRRLILFTERNAKNNILGKIEAREYMSAMDEQIRKIMSTTLEQLAKPASKHFQGVSTIPEEEIGIDPDHGDTVAVNDKNGGDDRHTLVGSEQLEVEVTAEDVNAGLKWRGSLTTHQSS